MYIEATIADDRGEHKEWYVCSDNTPDYAIWDLLDEIVERFNNTLYPNELPRHLVDIWEVDDIDKIVVTPLLKHKWRKTNLITIQKGGRMYDECKCEVCGITGRRYGLGDVTPDKKYQKPQYYSCVWEE